MSGVKLGGRESDLTIPECGLAIMYNQEPSWHQGEREVQARTQVALCKRHTAELRAACAVRPYGLWYVRSALPLQLSAPLAGALLSLSLADSRASQSEHIRDLHKITKIQNIRSRSDHRCRHVDEIIVSLRLYRTPQSVPS